MKGKIFVFTSRTLLYSDDVYGADVSPVLHKVIELSVLADMDNVFKLILILKLQDALNNQRQVNLHSDWLEVFRSFTQETQEKYTQ